MILVCLLFCPTQSRSRRSKELCFFEHWWGATAPKDYSRRRFSQITAAASSHETRLNKGNYFCTSLSDPKSSEHRIHADKSKSFPLSTRGGFLGQGVKIGIICFGGQLEDFSSLLSIVHTRLCWYDHRPLCDPTFPSPTVSSLITHRLYPRHGYI